MPLCSDNINAITLFVNINTTVCKILIPQCSDNINAITLSVNINTTVF